jgi:hypothetical protein
MFVHFKCSAYMHKQTSDLFSKAACTQKCRQAVSTMHGRIDKEAFYGTKSAPARSLRPPSRAPMGVTHMIALRTPGLVLTPLIAQSDRDVMCTNNKPSFFLSTTSMHVAWLRRFPKLASLQLHEIACNLHPLEHIYSF